jgi:O-acetyl-ADP-ribose deacetylase (regulator of RNase III)
MITYHHGNLLNDDAQVLVNPVNCVGVMPGGLARQFADRWPEILQPYADDCESGRLKLGTCSIGKTRDGRTVIHFPTMHFPGSAASLIDIESGLASLRGLILTDPDAFSTIAIPALGCGVGGLDWPDVEALIIRALADLPGDIRLYAPKA